MIKKKLCNITEQPDKTIKEIHTFTKEKLDNHVIEIRKVGCSGSYYQTTVIKTKIFNLNY